MQNLKGACKRLNIQHSPLLLDLFKKRLKSEGFDCHDCHPEPHPGPLVAVYWK